MSVMMNFFERRSFSRPPHLSRLMEYRDRTLMSVEKLRDLTVDLIMDDDDDGMLDAKI